MFQMNVSFLEQQDWFSSVSMVPLCAISVVYAIATQQDAASIGATRWFFRFFWSHSI